MYTLYWSPGTASLCVHWMLIELGEPHDQGAGGHRGGRTPQARVPEAEPERRGADAGRGRRAAGEAAALCMILAERHPQAGFAPADRPRQRAAYLSWMFFLSNTLQVAYHNWFYPDQPAGQSGVEAVKASARARIEAALDRVDRQIAAAGAYLLGDRVSAADFVTTMLMRWARNMPKPATEWPAIAGYVKRMKARPSFKVLYEREGLTEWN